MTRVCEWCGRPLSVKQVVACSSSHRLKRWRWLNGIPISPASGVEQPPGGSPLLLGHVHRRAARERRSYGAGGLQVSYRKAVKVLADRCGGGDPESLRWAEDVLQKALSERQRERLEARQ